ncbi:MAG TPA: LacI family DNA-binding transcriptional regulator [Opitutaceae bacterium]|nr:LacI family DNA-binding transcriptional regulator [Opitutaceae bacterium]
MNPRPTLADIARIVRVSKATVSLALRGHPKISARTSERVKNVAQQVGYRPDPVLARIAASRWRTRQHPAESAVAYIMWSHPWHREDEEMSPVMRYAAAEVGEQLGYRVERFKMRDYTSPKNLARVLFHRGIRAVIFGPIMEERVITDFPWDDFTSVGSHVGYFQPPVNVVVPDFHHAVVNAWREAMRAGYKRIGVALLQEMEAVDRFDKVSAALFCQSQLSPDLPSVPLQHFPIGDQSEFKKWMKTHRPDVVLGFNDTVAWWLDKCGARVPEKIGFISLDTTEDARFKDYAVTGMNPDYALIGRTAMRQLDILLRSNQVGRPERPYIVQVPSVWIAGETILARKSAAEASQGRLRK